MNFPAPTRGTVVKVASNGVLGKKYEGGVALLPSLQMPWIKGTEEIRQGLSSGAKSNLHCSGRLSSARGDVEHWIDPLWDSTLLL